MSKKRKKPKRERNIFINLAMVEPKDPLSFGISDMLEERGLGHWVPTLKVIKSGMTKSLKGLQKATQQAPLNPHHVEIADIRSLFSNEKAKLLHTIKTRKPSSIYELVKISRRDFKAVRQDLSLLERFGLIRMIKDHTKQREKLKPELRVDKLNLSINL